MNAEMTAAGAATIIIPVVYRDDYLGALRAMTPAAPGGSAHRRAVDGGRVLAPRLLDLPADPGSAPGRTVRLPSRRR